VFLGGQMHLLLQSFRFLLHSFPIFVSQLYCTVVIVLLTLKVQPSSLATLFSSS
jgi:hypothetical protein